jgi:hypothetical protein
MDVIGMLMSDEDARQVLRGPANGGKARANLAQAEARIDEDARLIGLHVSAIAGGTAAEDSQTNRHGLP